MCDCTFYVIDTTFLASRSRERYRNSRKSETLYVEIRSYIRFSFSHRFRCHLSFIGHIKIRIPATCCHQAVRARAGRHRGGRLRGAADQSNFKSPHAEKITVHAVNGVSARSVSKSLCLRRTVLSTSHFELVWQVKEDDNVLNAAGNLSDACNLAAVSALRHFHRPDVTVEEDGRVTIHTFAEMEPIPTYMKKIPVCLTFAFFMEEDTYYTLLDPTDIEERVQSGRLIIGLNPHGEITSLIFPGRVSLQKEQIMNCIQIAFSKAKATAEMIQKVVEEDLEKRKKKRVIKTAGFTKGLISDADYVKNKYDKMSDQMHKIGLLVSSIRNTVAQDDNEQNAVVEMEDSEEDEPLATGHYPPEEVRREKAMEVGSFLAAIRKDTEGNDAENGNEEFKEDIGASEDNSSEESNEEQEEVKEASSASNIDSFLSSFRKNSPSKVKGQVDETLESDSEEEEITDKLTSNDLG
ncbi:unnamed protein product, partial [Meganyctiphanes norvegica]